jgi:signal transduction histidine kinase
MSAILEQCLLLPATPPGSLAYHAILAFTIFGALQGALNSRREFNASAGKRMTVGLIAMLLLQVLQFIATGLVWQGLVTAEVLMPALDRATILLSLLIILWLWTYPTTNRLADAATILLGLVLVVLAAYTMVWWHGQQPDKAGIYFNGSAADVIGSSIGLLLILLGVFILVIRRPNNWGFGLGMLLGLAGGYLAHLLAPLVDQDFAGAVRLTEIAFFPLLLILPLRLPLAQKAIPAISAPSTTERASFRDDPKAQQELLKLTLASSPQQFYQDLAQMMSQLMAADICLLAMPELNDQYFIFPGGYNLITDSQTEGFSLEQRKIPTLVNSIRKNKLLHLPSGSVAPELKNLAQALKVDRAGAILATPIAEPGEPPMLGIVLLTTYSNHPWSEADQQFLREAAQAIAPVIQRMQQSVKLHELLEQSRQRMEALDGDATQAVSQNEQLISRLDTLQLELEEERQRSASLAALVSEHATLPEVSLPIDQANIVRDSLLKGAATPEYEQMEGDLRLVLEEMASLRQSLAQADQKILELQAYSTQSAPNSEVNDREVMLSIAQELRQPMSSIIGYTDLLLGESVGLLGALQRKFLERVKASSERMGGLLEELIQISSLDGKEMSLTPVMVDLNAVIDEAVSGKIAQLSEKSITLRVDLPDELPPIQADLEALQQILLNLLSNAIMATPADGEITLRVRVEAKENEPSFLLLQVTDQGGGIPPSDLPRVFSRLYRADNVLIQGIGDTGVGLAIVKTLVEAHNGRIWVDTEIDHGSAFSVLLPLETVASDEHSGEPAT